MIYCQNCADQCYFVLLFRLQYSFNYCVCVRFTYFSNFIRCKYSFIHHFSPKMVQLMPLRTFCSLSLFAFLCVLREITLFFFHDPSHRGTNHYRLRNNAPSTKQLPDLLFNYTFVYAVFLLTVYVLYFHQLFFTIFTSFNSLCHSLAIV